MSCGNRFQCGITRFQKHSFTPDKPSNQELHNENQKRLSDLLKAREEIDKQFLASTTKVSETSNSESLPLKSVSRRETPELLENTTYTPWLGTTDNNFTPWKVPSATDFQSKPK